MEAKKTKEVIPKKDWEIHQNEIHIELKKGKAQPVPIQFIDNLKTEKVI